MIICEKRQGQLTSDSARQRNHDAVEAAEIAEASRSRPAVRSMVAGLLAAMRTRRFGLLRTPSKRRVDCSMRGRIHSSVQRTVSATSPPCK